MARLEETVARLRSGELEGDGEDQVSSNDEGLCSVETHVKYMGAFLAVEKFRLQICSEKLFPLLIP